LKLFAALIATILVLAGCQSDVLASAKGGRSRPGDDSALSTMERIAVAAQKCWFSGKDAAFKGLRLSPELSSHSGKPRILAVPGKNIGGLPKLVIEATGNPAKLSAFGPLMDSEHAARIAQDVMRWAGRNTSCAGAG
jgi:hypothetical protein